MLLHILTLKGRDVERGLLSSVCESVSPITEELRGRPPFAVCCFPPPGSRSDIAVLGKTLQMSSCVY